MKAGEKSGGGERRTGFGEKSELRKYFLKILVNFRMI